MGTVTAGSIIDSAARTLFDDSKVRWTSTELLQYLNEGQRAIVLQHPEANPINTVIQLAAGTKQSLPAGGLEVIDLVRNMGVSGSTPGRAITAVSRDALDSADPDWHAAAASAEVSNYVFDPRDPGNFYVSPPQPSSPGQVEIIYSANPDDVAATTDPITLSDIYVMPLLYYVLSRALSKDSGQADFTKAASYYTLFTNALQGKQSGDRQLLSS